VLDYRILGLHVIIVYKAAKAHHYCPFPREFQKLLGLIKEIFRQPDNVRELISSDISSLAACANMGFFGGITIWNCSLTLDIGSRASDVIHCEEGTLQR
jgi:hypothetical protein